ncbi:MAG: TonB family protein [Bradyrhizobium sp.]|uniref:cell envelope integrity protein TolA n=1 Tax=Bradyrhizobium sp. TaxID=376 RepID=UPI00273155AF|nr:energy transducer TonB [Bradyrhizobium sp.]MDP1866099.1 TonB family protein [Bradyrhizobium sp.]
MSGLETEPRPSRRLWAFAAATALALHLGCGALAIAHLRESESENDLGANAIEVGLEFASLRREATDLPAGPDTDASVASPALAEQQAEVRETELPKDIPTETVEAERLVTPNESNRPKEEDTKIAAVQTQASTESVASEATATPSAEAIPEGPRSVAPALGSGETARRARVTWQKELMAHLAKHKRNPDLEKFKNTRVMVNVTLDRLGRVFATSIAKSSGDPAYDAAALEMLKRADPVPQPPPLVADEGLNFTLPVIFRVKGKS